MTWALLALLAVLLTPSAAAADWDAVARAPAAAIEGYASEVSVLPGRTLHLHVSTAPAQRYRVVFYRVGWYPGTAPPALACSPSCTSSVAGVARATPAPDPATGNVDAGWPVTDTFAVPADWSSGYYVAKLVLTTGPHATEGNFVPFVVRAAPGRTSAILVQASVSTWQAYNNWGSKNLYPNGSSGGVPANHVSFDRPYYAVGSGTQSLFDWEIQLARFLEREGYDVSYTTDVDVSRDPSSLLGHQLDIVAGHDEYWSLEQRNGYEAARDAGVNLAFYGANTGFWQIRYQDDYRTIVGYKASAPDPSPDRARTTVMWRNLDNPRPECRLLGVQSHGGLSSTPLDYTVQRDSLNHPWYANTGFAAGDTIGLIGYEWDGVQPGCATPPLTVFFHRQTESGANNTDATVYTAPSGARVFAAGSFKYTWGLDGYGQASGRTDARLQQFTRNQLDDLAGPAAHMPGTGLGPGTTPAPTKRADKQPPSVRILTPRPGARVRLGLKGYALRGRATDASGVRRVELSLQLVAASGRGPVAARRCRFFDGRHSLRRHRCGRPSFFAIRRAGSTWRYILARGAKLPRGSYDLRVRATDRAGNTNVYFTRSARKLVRFALR